MSWFDDKEQSSRADVYVQTLFKKKSLPMNHPTFAFLVDGLPNIGMVLNKLPLESLQRQFFVYL